MSNASEKSKRAIFYMLDRIQRTPRLAWYMISTESYSLLLDAASELSGLDRYTVERRYMPESTEDPYEKGRRDGIQECLDDPDSVIRALADAASEVIKEEPEPIVIHPRDTSPLDQIFAELDDALSSRGQGRVTFTSQRYCGHHEIKIKIDR